MVERFSPWTDAALGLSPFTQALSPSPGAFPLPHFRFASRATVLLLLAPLALALDSIAFALRASPTLAAPFRAGVRLLLSAALWACGVDVKHTTTRKHDVALPLSPTATARRDSASLEGALLLVTHTGWVDALVLAAALAPTFAVEAGAPGSRALVEAPLSHVLRASLLGPIAAPPGAASITTLLAGVASRGGRGAPCVLAPEGAPTNGRAILSFSPIVGELARAASSPAPPFRCLAVHYTLPPPPTLAPSLCCVGAEHPLHHARSLLCGSGGHCASLLACPPGYDPQPQDTAPWPAALTLAFEQLLRRWGVRQVRFSAQDHAKFLIEAAR